VYLFEEYYSYKCPPLPETVGVIDPTVQFPQMQSSDNSRITCTTTLVLSPENAALLFRYHFGVRRANSIALDFVPEGPLTIFLEDAGHAFTIQVSIEDNNPYIEYNSTAGYTKEPLTGTLQFYRKSSTELEVFTGNTKLPSIKVPSEFAVHWVELKTLHNVRIKSLVAAEELLSVQVEDFEIDGPDRFLTNSLVTYTAPPGRYIWTVTPTKPDNLLEYIQYLSVGPLKIALAGSMAASLKCTILITDNNHGVNVSPEGQTVHIVVAVSTGSLWNDVLALLNDYTGRETLLVTATGDIYTPAVPDVYVSDVDITSNQVTFRVVEEDLIVVTAIRVAPTGLLTKTRTTAAVHNLPAVHESIDRTLWLYLSDIWGRVENRGIIEASWNAIIHKYTDYLMRAYQEQLTRGLTTTPTEWVEMWVPVTLQKTLKGGEIVANSESITAKLTWTADLKFKTDALTKYPVFVLNKDIVTLKPTVSNGSEYFTASQYPVEPSFTISVSGTTADDQRVLRGVPQFGTWVTYLEGVWRKVTIERDLSVTFDPELNYYARWHTVKAYPMTFTVNTGCILKLPEEVTIGDEIDGAVVRSVYREYAIVNDPPTNWVLQRKRSLPIDADYISDVHTPAETIPGYLFHKEGTLFVCDKEFTAPSAVLPYVLKSNIDKLHKYFGGPMGLPLLDHSATQYKRRLHFVSRMYLYPHQRNAILSGILAMIGVSVPTKDLTVTAVSEQGGILTVYTEEDETLRLPKNLLKQTFSVGDTINAHEILVNGIEVQTDTVITILMDSGLVLTPQYIPSAAKIIEIIQPARKPLQLIFKITTAEDLSGLPAVLLETIPEVTVWEDWTTDNGGFVSNPYNYTGLLDVSKGPSTGAVYMDTDGWKTSDGSDIPELRGAFSTHTSALYGAETFLQDYQPYAPTWYDGENPGTWDRMMFDRLDYLAPLDRVFLEVESTT
jgi:hypothetical protein